MHIHGATAEELLGESFTGVEQVWQDPENAEINEKLKCLLEITARAQKSGLGVGQELIQKAKENGITDREVHDTVLITAAFSMFNRYVDGLATWAPEYHEQYKEHAKVLAKEGYMRKR